MSDEVAAVLTCTHCGAPVHLTGRNRIVDTDGTPHTCDGQEQTTNRDDQGGDWLMAVSKKQAIPFATRRAVALAAGAVAGTRSAASCHYCGRAGEVVWHLLRSGRPGAWVSFVGLELDHVFPESLGGTTTADNLVLACRPCNRRKGARLEWRASAA